MNMAGSERQLMFENDQVYYRHRAKIETELARKAPSPAVAHVHHQLAEAYTDRLAAVKSDKVEAS